jgi:hypothetical protein
MFFKHTNILPVDEISTITVPVARFIGLNSVTLDEVGFKIYKEHNHFRAVPLLSKEERIATGLPEELLFVYISHCITSANNMEEETLDVIKKIVQELQVQELL